MRKNLFSKDPKVNLVSVEEFLESCNFLSDAKERFWEDEKKPEYGVYYKITPRLLIMVYYSRIISNFGMSFSESLNEIQVAFRDGKTEYDLIDKRMDKLFAEKSEHSENKEADEEIEKLKESKRLLNSIQFALPPKREEKAFEEYLVDTGFQTTIEPLKNKYVVIDVETNGLRHSNDDLLSISIFDPSTGKSYNRFLPLDLQPMVLTGWIHGIKDEALEKETHITQDELNKVIEYFDLTHKTILSYSGGKGAFDSAFIINYCKRHNLVGFENLHYENIKTLITNSGFGTKGQMTKDNLCRLLKIDGIQEIHSGLNDCVLEWKLFERLKNDSLFFIDENLYNFHEGYIIPVSYLNHSPELVEYAKISVPNIVGKANCIFSFQLPPKIVKSIKKFPTNITGVTLENGINAALNAEKQDNCFFLAKNKSHLEYIGSLENNLTEIPVEAKKDGTIKSLDARFDEDVKIVNEVTKLVISCLDPVIKFIRESIFNSSKIMSQELVISEDGKVLALCDLSNESVVLEIKTFHIGGDIIDGKLARQLYYESKGRKTFVLSIDIVTHRHSKNESITDEVNVRIYQVQLEETELFPVEKNHVLSKYEIDIIKMLKENPNITISAIAEAMKLNPNSISKRIKWLKCLKYIEREDESSKKSKWIVLRTPDDNKTKYSDINGEIVPIFDEKIQVNK